MTEPWRERAVCAGVGPEVFFPDDGGHYGEARKLCASCPVTQECLEEVLEVPHYLDYGFRGGTTPNQRRMMREQTEPRVKERECHICAAPFHAVHPNAKYCSNTCRNVAWRRRGPGLQPVACVVDGVVFTPNAPSARFCSDECRRVSQRERWRLHQQQIRDRAKAA